MKIDIRTEECLYIEINGWTYYIDDSTNEQITDKWVTGTEEEYPEKCSNLDYNVADAPTERDLAEWNSDPKV
tara:strand:+ start:41 stop:256 length:216 start_codon:yes stop_codon:yes gene_type:complete